MSGPSKLERFIRFLSVMEQPASFMAALGWMTCELWFWGARPAALTAILTVLAGKQALRLYSGVKKLDEQAAQRGVESGSSNGDSRLQ